MKSLTIVVLCFVMASLVAACVQPGTAPSPTATARASVAPTSTTLPTQPSGPAPTQAAAPVPTQPRAAGSPIRVGSKDFTEELILGEMYASLLEANGVPVERKLNLAGTQVAHEALVRGEIDLYPEYTGTGYLFILGIKDNDKDPAVVYQKTAAGYQQKWGLTWLDRSPMNDTNAIACTSDAAQKYNLNTLDDLAKAAANINFAAIPDFPQRPDGLVGLKQLYGGFDFKSMNIYDPGLKYRAVQEGKADCVIAFSTDAKIAALKLKLLEDTKGLWPPYNVAPVMRSDALQQYPQVKDLLNKLAPLITTEVITDLNFKVDEQKQEYGAVAKDFLKSKGLTQ